MPSALSIGVATRYEALGDGPPPSCTRPGGFDATIEKWRVAGVYERIRLLEHLPQKFRCIAFDRRECGESGGRVSRSPGATMPRMARRSSTSASAPRT